MSIAKTLTSLNKSSSNRPISDTDILKWANTTAAKAKPNARAMRSFKDPALTTGVFLLDVLEGIKPGIVDPTLISNVSETGDYDERKQNGTYFLPLSWAHRLMSLL
jgi:plastin-1